MNKRKGFTLIELLAVIVIPGLLMAIAIPSVTKYITESRKKTVVSTIGNYITATVNEVNDLTYTFTEENTIYAVPIECIALERGGTNPFGAWHQSNDSYWAYVLVQYDDETSSYRYGYTFKDSAGYGLYPTAQSKLNEGGKQIKTGLNLNRPKNGKVTIITAVDNWNGFSVDSTTNLVVLIPESEGNIGNGTSTCTLQQKGDNYIQVEEEKVEANKPGKVVSGTGTDIGDKICFGSECFFVIESDLSTITMLAEEKIDVTVDDPKQNASAPGRAFSNSYYWYDGELKPEYGNKVPAFVYDSNSALYQYIEAYEDYLQEDLGVSSASASMISEEQVEKLGCSGSGCDGSPYKNWVVRGYTWWTGSAHYYLGYLGSNGVYGLWEPQSRYGVRPIITVDKTQIKF